MKGGTVKSKSGILLDLGCGVGAQKMPGFVGMDRRRGEGVDIVHDIEKFPYPLKAGACLTVTARNVLEHVKPWLTVDLFNEVWRILRPGGQFVIVVPYAGSPLYWHDPTHCNGFTETTFNYFNIDSPLYHVYKPKPWRIQEGTVSWQVTGMMETVLVKVGDPHGKN